MSKHTPEVERILAEYAAAFERLKAAGALEKVMQNASLEDIAVGVLFDPETQYYVLLAEGGPPATQFGITLKPEASPEHARSLFAHISVELCKEIRAKRIVAEFKDRHGVLPSV